MKIEKPGNPGFFLKIRLAETTSVVIAKSATAEKQDDNPDTTIVVSTAISKDTIISVSAAAE